MGTNVAYLARMPSKEKLSILNDSYNKILKDGLYDPKTAYILNPNNTNTQHAFPNMQNKNDILTRLSGINLILPNGKDLIEKKYRPLGKAQHSNPGK